MGIRAHRAEVKFDFGYTTFNMGDEKLVDFLGTTGALDALDFDCCGIIEIQVETLKKALSKATELELDEYVIGNIKKDIEWAEQREDDYIFYYVF